MLPVLTGCVADHIGTTYGEGPRDLTSAELRPRLAADRRVLAEAFPLGAPADGRRCGGPLGITAVPGLPGREPLRSSIAWATDGLLGNPFQPGQTYERQLRAASIRHDFCYGHGLATYGRTRRDCDLWIRADAERLCSSVEGSLTRARCTLRGDIPFLAVAPLGWTFYRDNLQPTCEYDPGVNPPRDFVLGGEFLRAPLSLLRGQILHVSPEEGGILRLRITGFATAGPPRQVTILDLALPLDAIPVTANRDGPPPDGRCLRAPCSLAGAGLRPQDFLALAPKVADLDGDGLDDIAFAAVHGLREPYGPAYGLVAFAVSPAALPADGGRAPAAVAAGMVRTQDEEASALPDGRLSRAAVRQQIDVLGQTWLAGRFLPEPRDQLLLVALRVERDAGERRLTGAQERGFAEFRLLDFPPDGRAGYRLGPPRLRRTLFRDDGVYFTRHHDRQPLTELYRRFQNPPMRWQDAGGRAGVLLLARDYLDAADAGPFRTPSGVWSLDSQDRGVRVLAYGPPAPPSALPVARARLVTERGPPRRTGCADLTAWDPDWLGCRDATLRPTISERFVWNWTREVNPVLELPDGSGRFAAVALDAAREVASDPGSRPLVPAREALVFYLTPPLHPVVLRRPPEGDHKFVTRDQVVPATEDGSADGPNSTVAGSWLAYPALAAKLGPAGEAGVALFRTSSDGHGSTALEIAAAIPHPDGITWEVSRAICRLPSVLAQVNGTDARPGAEGGAMAHLRLSPVLRIAGGGQRDAFVVATRQRRDDGSLASAEIVMAAIVPIGLDGWAAEGEACRPTPFGERSTLHSDAHLSQQADGDAAARRDVASRSAMFPHPPQNGAR